MKAYLMTGEKFFKTPAVQQTYKATPVFHMFEKFIFHACVYETSSR